MAQLPIGSDPFVLKSENKFQNFIFNSTQYTAEPSQPVLNYNYHWKELSIKVFLPGRFWSKPPCFLHALRVRLITDTLYYILTNTTCVLLLHYKSWFLHAAYIGTTIMRSIKHILFHHTAVPPQIDDRDVNETSRNSKIFGCYLSLLSLSYWRIYKDTFLKGLLFNFNQSYSIQLLYPNIVKIFAKFCLQLYPLPSALLPSPARTRPQPISRAEPDTKIQHDNLTFWATAVV